MRINSIRRLLYKVSRVLGVVNEVKKGKVGKRVGRRVAGKSTEKLLSTSERSDTKHLVF